MIRASRDPDVAISSFCASSCDQISREALSKYHSIVHRRLSWTPSPLFELKSHSIQAMFFSHIMATRYSRLIIILFFLFEITVAVYSEQHPPDYENYDPTEANPKINLTCLRDHSRLNLPYSRSCRFDPNGASMQKLCAKPQYQGGPPGQHLGGFCPVLSSSVNGSMTGPGEIAFDHRYSSIPGARACIELLHSARLLPECHTNCFCNY